MTTILFYEYNNGGHFGAGSYLVFFRINHRRKPRHSSEEGIAPVFNFSRMDAR